MRFNEIDTQKTLTEAPLGFFSKMGNKAAAWAGDKMGGTDFGARASGRLDTGKLANQLHAAFQYYLGQTGSKPTARAVLAFLQSKGYPVKSAKTILNKAAAALANKNKFNAPASPTKGMDQQVGSGSTAGTATDLGNVVSEGVNDPLPQKAIDQAFLAAAQEAIMMKASGGATKPAAKTPATTAPAVTAPAAKTPSPGDDIIGHIKSLEDPLALQYIASAAQRRMKELSSAPAMAESKKAKK